MTDDALHPLLEAAADLGPEYGRSLASHLPMALGALHGLGADGPRLRAFFERYRADHGLAPAPALPLLDVTGEPAVLGRLADWPQWRHHFRQALQREGRDAVLRRLLPRLMPGVAGAAFHGLIRTAHAVHADHAGELAAALAYWAARWLALPLRAGVGAGLGAGEGGSEWSPSAVLPDVVGDPDAAEAADPADAWSHSLVAADAPKGIDGRMIVDRVAQVAVHPAFQPWAGPLPPSEDWPARWARAAAQRYVSSGSFTVLHLITATHAFRVLRPWMSEGAAHEQGHFGSAYAAAWLSARTDPRASDRPDPGLDWPAIRARALASDDDHVIKLVWSALAEAGHHGGDVWRHAAALAVEHGT